MTSNPQSDILSLSVLVIGDKRLVSGWMGGGAGGMTLSCVEFVKPMPMSNTFVAKNGYVPFN